MIGIDGLIGRIERRLQDLIDAGFRQRGHCGLPGALTSPFGVQFGSRTAKTG
jgi:hypothetical protein